MQLHELARFARAALAACAVLLTSLAVAVASTDEWFDGAPPDGSFHVRGPVAFQAFAQEDQKSPKTAPSTQGVRASQPGAFDALTKYVASCQIDKNDRRAAKVRLEETLLRWQQQAPFSFRRDVANGKLAGVEFEMSDPAKTLRLRVFAAPERVCTAFVQWNPYAKPREADVERFLASFALTP